MPNPKITIEVASIGTKATAAQIKRVEKGAEKLRKTQERLAKAQKKAARTGNRFKNTMTEIGKSASLALGPLNGVAARFTAFSGLVTTANFRLAGFIGALVGAGGLVFAAKKAANFMDELRKKAEFTGFSVENFQELQFAASQIGLEADQATKAMVSFTNRLGKAQEGSGEAARSFTRLFGSLVPIVGLKADEALLITADAFQGLEGSAAGASISVDLFTKRGAGFSKMLNEGSAGLKRFGKQARDLGIVLEKELILQSTKAVDAFDAMSKVIKINLIRVISDLIPVITEVSLVVARLGPVIRDNIGLITTALLALIGVGAGLIFGPIGAIIGGLAGVGAGTTLGNLDAILERLRAIVVERETLAQQSLVRPGMGRVLPPESLPGEPRPGMFGVQPPPSLQVPADFGDPFTNAIKSLITMLELFEVTEDDLERIAKLAKTAFDEGIAKAAVKSINALRSGAADANREFEILTELSDKSGASLVNTFSKAKAFIRQFDDPTLKNAAAELNTTVEELTKSIDDLFRETAQRTQLTKLFNETRTAAEKYKLTLDELNLVQPKTAAQEEILTRALSNAKRAFIDVDAASQIFVNSLRMVGDGLVDALTGAKTGMEALRETAKQIVDAIIKEFIRLAVVNQILNAVFQLGGAAAFPTLGGGSGSGAGIGGAPELNAHGSSFKVSGAGGIDSQRVSFRATPGEQVTVTPANKVGAEGGGNTFILQIGEGTRANVRAEIRDAMPEIVGVIQAQIFNQAKRSARFREPFKRR